VPLRVVDLAARAGAAAPAAGAEPLIAAPDGASLALFRALQPLAVEPGLRRVVVTLLDAASIGGRGGLDALHRESIALFNQQDLPEPEYFDRPVAFDCLPAVGELDATGESTREARLRAELSRLLAAAGSAACSVWATAVQVPAFVGIGACVWIESGEPIDAKRAAERLRAAPGVELSDDPRGPTPRASSGADSVRVGRLRSAPGGLSLWLVADSQRLAAIHAVTLAEARLSGRPDALRARAQ
jgi:aspartate-semialdehyde dehydrogenase